MRIYEVWRKAAYVRPLGGIANDVFSGLFVADNIIEAAAEARAEAGPDDYTPLDGFHVKLWNGPDF